MGSCCPNLRVRPYSRVKYVLVSVVRHKLYLYCRAGKIDLPTLKLTVLGATALKMKTISANKKTFRGVIHAMDGSVVCAKLKVKRGHWKVEGVDSWFLSNTSKTVRRLSGGAVLGLRAEWGVSDSALELPAVGANAGMNPCLRSAEYNVILEALSGNVTSLIVEDSFLLTLPLAFCANPAASFLSVYFEDGLVTLGVAVEKKLEAVFSFPCPAVSYIEASAARVRRYWEHVLKRDDFPRKAFIFDCGAGWQNDDCDGLAAETLILPKELSGGDAVKAAGAALAPAYPVPAFRVPPAYSFRVYRSLLLKISAALLCLSVIITSASFLANTRAGMKLAHSEEEYHSRLNENKALQELNKTADELAVKILSTKKAYTQSTRWGTVLTLLSEIKPDDLFLERLGTDHVAGAENSVRIALSGWARTETSVTEFISGLQASGFITNVSLSSMERDARNGNICRFRILCTMQLYND